MVLAQLIEKSAFLSVQSSEVRRFRLCLYSPERPMFKERMSIHEKGYAMGKEFSKLIENGKAVGIDISPIVDVFLLQPESGSEIVKAVSCSENHHCIGNIRESQKVDLVFGDEHFRYRQVTLSL